MRFFLKHIALTNWLSLLVLLAVSSAAAQDSRFLKAGETIQLNGPTIWKLDRLTAQDGATVITNSNPFTIFVDGALDIQGTLTIRSFDPSLMQFLSLKPPRGIDGIGFNPGPGSSGSGPSVPGRDGGAGQQGEPGSKGANGRDAGSVTLTLLGRASGKLRILNNGGAGTIGGPGGDGGNGGSGEQGGVATPQRVVFGIAAGCKAGPGHGGDGGNAGNGGPGGPGGDGGNGGPILVTAFGDASDLSVLYSLSGGPPGAGGPGGSPGQPGQPGFGGRGAPGCEGRVTERRGRPGSTGTPGPPGPSGRPGQSGLFIPEGNFMHIQEG